MALYYNNIQDIPQTHILIIGVGNYPYLSGGTEKQEFNNDYLNSLGQLSSPPASAAFMFEQFLQMANEGWFNPEVGSIEVLVDDNIIPGYQSEEPTKLNIRRAYARWKQRSDKHEDNVALCYFAGHGFGITDHCLLPKDFGDDPNVPFENGIAIDKTITAFRSCQAKTQIFLIDACRLIPPETRFQDIVYSPLDTADIMLPEPPNTLIMKAASNNEGSYGKKNSASFFANAVIKGMRNYGAVNLDDNWRVETGDLVKGINSWLKLEKTSEGYPQRCISTINDSYQLLNLPAAPEVSLNLNCKPEEALPLAKLSYANLNAAQITRSRAPDPAPWTITVPAGIYRMSAEFQDQQFQATDLVRSINPPVANHNLQCQKAVLPDLQIEVSQA
ncbi:caspase family protein [Mucilaginibacter phyllosphaerae]